MPAPKENINALRHGLRTATLPKGCKYIEGAMQTFRMRLEDMIYDRHQGISVYQAAVIHSAVRHERRGMLSERWLRKEGGSLSLPDRLGLLREISNATDARDKCLKSLGLDEIETRSLIDVVPPIASEPPDVSSVEVPA